MCNFTPVTHLQLPCSLFKHYAENIRGRGKGGWVRVRNYKRGRWGRRCVRRYSQSGHQSFKKSQLSFSFSRHTPCFPLHHFSFWWCHRQSTKKKEKRESSKRTPKRPKKKKSFSSFFLIFHISVEDRPQKCIFHVSHLSWAERKFMNAFPKRNREGFISPNDSFSKACVLALQLSCSAAP